MWRLTDRIVRSTLVTAWFFADCPTRTSPFLAKATTEGVVREPSEFAMTVGSPPSRTVTTELVVPRSIPTARAMGWISSVCTDGGAVVAGQPAALRVVRSTFLPTITARRRRLFPGPRRPCVRSRGAVPQTAAPAGSRHHQAASDVDVHRSSEGIPRGNQRHEAPPVHPLLRAA